MDKNKDNQDNKALFVQRLVAYVIDVIIITFVTSLLVSPFIDEKEANKLNNKSTEIVEQYINKEIDTKTYTLEFMNVSYNVARNNGLLTITTIIMEILYFIVFQIYKGGQTVGKMLMKIKIVSDNNELSMNQMIFRNLVANSILLNIITFTFMIFGSKDIYFYATGIFSFIQYILIFISTFMVMFRNDGCAVHDKLAHTKVVRI